MPAPKVTPDGWVVSDPNDFYFLTAHEPPRPNAVWRQLWTDARSWKPLAMWGVGGGLIAAAIFTEWWVLIGAGVGVFYFWFRLFWHAVPYLRNSTVLEGAIEHDLRPHPIFGNTSTAIATTPDGREIPVFFYTEHVTELFQQTRTVEVVFLYDPDSQYCMVLGARART